jgi:hypothetical protein
MRAFPTFSTVLLSAAGAALTALHGGVPSTVCAATALTAAARSAKRNVVPAASAACYNDAIF